jgi:phosphoribosylamine---glycine ligase
MLDACNGKDSLKVRKAIACGVVIAQPDYPYSKLTDAKVTDIPIYGVTPENEPYLAPQSVKRERMPVMKGSEIGEDEIWTTTGDYLAVVTGTGSTVRQARTRCYDTLHELSVPDMIYRDDVGEKLEEEIPQLQELGYAEEFNYG